MILELVVSTISTLACIALVLVIYFVFVTPKGKELGESCAIAEDCKGYGLGDDQVACCGGKCTKKDDGWCPGDGANAGSPIGGSCSVATDCQNWGWGIGGKGTLCCGGVCRENPDLLAGCPEADLGQPCNVATDCKGWGGFGDNTLCCNGKCTENRYNLLVCPYPSGTWLSAIDVPNAYKLCASGRANGSYCA